ncbi:MAG: hypothetical protein GQ574_28760 [Crocinitomix sp.]|nr:hypothetical protein [Crocinitomix sp.]
MKIEIEPIIEIELGSLDENGWKQGLFIDTSNHLIYHRTYVNDTLNGAFSKYTEYGILETSGAYKNHESDGKWIYYQPDGTTASISNYDIGLRQGEFKEYYVDGTLKYEGSFNADTMIGNVQNYFEDGTLKSAGNRQNGTWKTYFQNQQVASIENFSKAILIGELEKFDSTGLKTLPIFLPEKDADTCVVNATDLEVKILYETDRHNRKVAFNEYLFSGAQIGRNGQDLITKIGPIILDQCKKLLLAINVFSFVDYEYRLTIYFKISFTRIFS